LLGLGVMVFLTTLLITCTIVLISINKNTRNMKKIIVSTGIIVLIILVIKIISPARPLQFSIDPGIRIQSASNPIAYQIDGKLYLKYQVAGENKNAIAITENETDFSKSNLASNNFHTSITLPNGTYRTYYFDMTDKVLLSESSVDGKTYSLDEGVRYTPAVEDNGFMGVFTFFVDNDGGVVLLYNNSDLENPDEVVVRRAYSLPGDNGENFELENFDVLDFHDVPDVDDGFRDPDAIVLPNGNIRLIVMHEGSKIKAPLGQTGVLYSFISTDGGKSFELESNDLVSWDDFTEFEVRALNDPKIVQLADGRFRIYVAAMITQEDGSVEYSIVSLTSK